jgi:methyl-accepting chemotaxis protein
MRFTFSLYFQVTVLFVLISIFSVVGAGTLNYLESRKIIISQFNKSMKDISTTIGSSLNAKADDAAEAIMRISQNETLLAESADEIQKFLQVAVDSSSLFNNIYYFSPEGPLRAAAYADGRDPKRYADENFMNYAEQEKTSAVYLDLVRALETRTPVFSAFFKSNTGRLMNSFIVPVVREERVIGLLSCGIVLDRTSKLLEMMESLKPHPNGYVALINNEGSVLLKAGDMPEGFAPGADWQNNQDQLIRSSGYLQAVLRLEKSGLGICTGLPEDAVAELLNRLRTGTISFTFGVGLLVCIFGIFAASVLTAPLNDLVNGLKQLRSGRSGERIDRRASGEIAEAIAIYNDLSDKIRKDAVLNKTWEDLWKV